MLFFLTGQVSSVGAKTDSGTALVWGALLMLGYLGFDGFTSTFQDSLFKGFSMSTFNQMLYVNAFSSLVSLFGETVPWGPAQSANEWHMPIYLSNLRACHTESLIASMHCLACTARPAQ